MSQGLIINGWCVLAHSVFLKQLESLLQEVTVLQKRDPISYKKKNATKRLAAIISLISEKIPQNPMLPEYWLGNTLGKAQTHWFRTKFFQQYRLFFRYTKRSWVFGFYRRVSKRLTSFNGQKI